MKSRFLLALLLCVQISFGQTAKFQKVSGTRCSLVPPPGFVKAKGFSGFQELGSGASIMVNELATSYQSLAEGFTAEALKTRGVKLLSKETIELNGAPATYIDATQSSNGLVYYKQILILGNEQGAVLVNGISPEKDKDIQAQIKTAMLSTVYSAAQNDNPLEAASFTIDTKGTEFKPVKYISGSVIYTTDGKLPTEKPTLIVGNSTAKIKTKNQLKYTEERLKKLPGGRLKEIKQTNEITIDSLNGYEMIAERTAPGNTTELLYQAMLYTEDGGYYIIVGQAKEKLDEYAETFRQVARSFRRK